MTHPMAVQFQENTVVGELDGDEITVQFLADIQHSYEEAKACIDDLPRSSWPAAPDGTEPHPGTEKIDLRVVELPAVPAAPTAAMSLAARVVAEQAVGEPEARVVHDSADLATATPRRGRVAAVISRWFLGSAAIAPTACDG